MTRRARALAAALVLVVASAGAGVYAGWSSGWLKRFDPTRRTVVFRGDSIKRWAVQRESATAHRRFLDGR